MTVEIARMRIAKIRNDISYSQNHLNKKGLINNKENNNSYTSDINWFAVR